MSKKLVLPVVLAVAFVATTGCLDAIAGFEGGSATSADVGGPGFHVRHSDFYHSYRANEETYTDEFEWENPEGRALLEVRNGISSGSERVVLKDAKGATVWSQTFTKDTPGGEYHPGNGEPGAWTIIIEREASTGQFDIHVWRDVRDANGA